MKNESAQFEEAAKQLPLLAGDEADEVDSPPQMAGAQEDDFEEDGTTAQERSYDIPGPSWQGYVFASLPIAACMFGVGGRLEDAAELRLGPLPHPPCCP
jgi:hypothetical protein